jgi:hypothetical protein
MKRKTQILILYRRSKMLTQINIQQLFSIIIETNKNNLNKNMIFPFPQMIFSRSHQEFHLNTQIFCPNIPSISQQYSCNPTPHLIIPSTIIPHPLLIFHYNYINPIQFVIYRSNDALLFHATSYK